MIKREKRDKMIAKSAEKRYRSRIFLDAARAVLTLILRKYAFSLTMRVYNTGMVKKYISWPIEERMKRMDFLNKKKALLAAANGVCLGCSVLPVWLLSRRDVANAL